MPEATTTQPTEQEYKAEDLDFNSIEKVMLDLKGQTDYLKDLYLEKLISVFEGNKATTVVDNLKKRGLPTTIYASSQLYTIFANTFTGIVPVVESSLINPNSIMLSWGDLIF